MPAYSCILPVIRDCLKERKDRPTAAQLCHSLGQRKNTPAYSGSHSAVLLEVGFIIPNTIVLVELFRYFLCLYAQGRTELHDAAVRGDVEAVERLLSTSVNVNSRTEDVRLSTSECVVSFLTQFIDCCSTGLCIPTTCRKDTLLYS